MDNNDLPPGVIKYERTSPVHIGPRKRPRVPRPTFEIIAECCEFCGLVAVEYKAVRIGRNLHAICLECHGLTYFEKPDKVNSEPVPQEYLDAVPLQEYKRK